MKNEISQVKLAKIEQDAANIYGITHEAFSSPNRKRANVGARHIVWKLLYDEYGISATDIGRQYKVFYGTGYADHSTVIYGIKRCNDMIDTEEDTAFKYNTLLNRHRKFVIEFND